MSPVEPALEPTEPAPRLTSFPEGGMAIVIGATGGIGSAVADAMDRSGRFADVIRLGRRTSPRLDLLDDESIAAAAAHTATRLGHGRSVSGLRLVFDATGLLHDTAAEPEKSWRALDAAQMMRLFAINAAGPALLMKHFLPLLAREQKSVFATISAKVGSIGDNHLGGWYSYRASKAALNQFVRTAAIELKRRSPHAVCVALHPGTVATRLSEKFARNAPNVQSPTQSAARMLAVLDTLTDADTGGFFSYSGERLPW